MTVPNLVLYRANGSCSMIPHILLLELCLPFTPILMTRGPSGALQSADGTVSADTFAALNPKRLVPTLTVDGTVVTEGPAILTCIASLAPENDLLGRTQMEKVKVLEWMVWLSSTLHGQGFGKFWVPGRFVSGEGEGLTEAVKKSGREQIEAGFESVEKKLPGGKWAVGGHLTTVDVQLHTFWRWGKAIGVDMEERFPRFREVVQNVEGRESVKRAMEEEGQELCFGK
ncbi:glutathione S-transferase [Myriangium duriaei CBS 260.36]|uniref:Glutathione S-transferase n=1 Tax=Myriangium duriaei CBS 260.36 TaxID=1168546 RepID=A0A9P4MDD1_9PEZI|nr:glutathione S-transferase [Myriangium duriaei CBS 260.36]